MGYSRAPPSHHSDPATRRTSRIAPALLPILDPISCSFSCVSVCVCVCARAALLANGPS